MWRQTRQMYCSSSSSSKAIRPICEHWTAVKSTLGNKSLVVCFCFYFFPCLLQKKKDLLLKPQLPGAFSKSVRSCWSNIVRQKGFLMPLWKTLKPRRCNLERKRRRTSRRRRRPDRSSSSSSSGCSSSADPRLGNLRKVINVHGLQVF